MNAGRRGPHDPAGLKVSGLVYVHDTAVKEHLKMGGKQRFGRSASGPLFCIPFLPLALRLIFLPGFALMPAPPPHHASILSDNEDVVFYSCFSAAKQTLFAQFLSLFPRVRDQSPACVARRCGRCPRPSGGMSTVPADTRSDTPGEWSRWTSPMRSLASTWE